MSAVDNLDTETQQQLAREAVKAASELGYCDEAVNVLERMGFVLHGESRTLEVKTKLEVPFGFDVENAKVYITVETDSGDNVEAYLYAGDRDVSWE